MRIFLIFSDLSCEKVAKFKKKKKEEETRVRAVLFVVSVQTQNLR